MNDSSRPATHIAKHSLLVNGHKTSVSLEDAFWRALRDMAAARGVALSALVSEIDSTRETANLSSAIRVYVLTAAKQKATTL